MSPENRQAPTRDFTDKVPPIFNGISDYASYIGDVQLWVRLTSLEASKQGAALVGRLIGGAKSSAKSLSVDNICCEEDVESLLNCLDKSYAVDAANQLDADLAHFWTFAGEKNSL